jgi:uncharacterized membrane protein
MYSKIKIAGHPVHPMLINYPVALYTASVVCYIVYGANTNPFWFKVAVVANGAGVLMAIVAALPGFIDWLAIPGAKKAKKVGLNHMLCNVGALLLFAINFFMQYKKWNEAQPDASPSVLLTVLGLILTVIAGFLGWSLIQNHHVGISLTEEQKRLEPQDGVKSN